MAATVVLQAVQTFRLYLLIVLAQFIVPGHGSLLSIPSQLDEQMHSTFLPNERESIDDCHLRYYKYGAGPEPLPAFGRPAYLREFAHMAAVGWKRTGGKIDWDCGGSLIWENYVLTAAHCTADDTNTPPNVVRLGDINIYDDSDDQYAQQLEIVEIVRHPEHRFSSRYHDLALLRLEKNVKLHDTVAPGCLWNDDDIPFPSMEATGWGSTGFGQASTPILLKVSLSFVNTSDCERQYRAGDRGLKEGLRDYHLCAGDIKMDTCPGDSGGPLQARLLHNGKMTPFIVAVTSFGSVCGQSTPGVYMKVAPYIPWIRTQLAMRGEAVQEWSFKPYACALRYVHLREYEDDVIISKSEGFEGIDSSKAHMSILDSQQTVTIHWPEGTNGPQNCHGVVIDEDTLITLASCVTFDRKKPSHILYYNGTRNDIVLVHRHPMYRPNSYYNDIAVMKTKDRFQFSSRFVPACIWGEHELPDPRFYVTGKGRRDLNRFDSYSEPITKFEPEIVALSPRADLHLVGNCSIPEQYFAGLKNGLSGEHLCFGNKPFLVPDSCQMLLGAPLRRRVWRMDRNFEHIYALNLFGKDCGFGRSAVATRFSAHQDWLRSVLLANYADGDTAVQFIDTDLKSGDPCVAIGGGPGKCVDIGTCPKAAYDVMVNRTIRYCKHIPLVCCPLESVKSLIPTNAAGRELDDCEDRYKMFHEEYEEWQPDRVDHYYHMVYIGWQNGQQMRWSCPGTLISRSLVITSAYCLTGNTNRPTVVNVADGNPDEAWNNPKVVRIREVIIHPSYNATGLLHDIGLVRLENDIVPTAHKYPICLWANQTHTPFFLRRMVMINNKTQFINSYPKYNSDCQAYLAKYGSRKLYSSELCTEIDDMKLQSLSGDPLVWYKLNTVDDSSTQFLTGIVSYGHSGEQLFVHSRISSYIDWIKSVL